MEGYFKQTIPGYDITIERNTRNVLKDGKYNVILKNKIVYSAKVLKLAQSKFTALLKELGYSPKKMEERLMAEDVKNVLNKQRADQLSRAYDAYWDNSSKFRKGGRLNRR